MKPLEPSDQHHLHAAQGWLELGNHLEANEELEKITPELHKHPDVLFVRWSIYAMAKKWDVCVDLAKAFTKLLPDVELGWVNLANSLYFSGHTQEAYDCLKPLLGRFPKSFILPYDLACYTCQLGNLEEARCWLEKAYALDTTQKLKLVALDDPDLEPLRKDIGMV